MQYTRAGARRRRVLASDAAVDAQETATTSGSSTAQPPVPDNRYADGALAERQLRVTDLIPRRRLTLVLLAAALAAVVAGLVDLYGCFFIDSFAGDRAALAALDLRRPGNLADWCASTSMLVCAAACLLVFAVRRHRTDDYRGGYFNWVWLAVLFALCSIWLATPVRDALAEAVSLLAGRGVGADALQAKSYFVLGALGIVVLAALRMAFEMRESRAALACLLAAGMGWAVASAVRHRTPLAAGQPRRGHHTHDRAAGSTDLGADGDP